MAAARRLIDLEGFGQEWMSLAILAARHGDQATVLDAITRARAGPPVDPVVELNAVALLDAAGDHAGAEAAARRLLEVQPDIERIVRTGPPAMAAVVAAVRAEVAARRMAASDPGGAFLIALSGEDRALADELLGRLSTSDVTGTRHWQAIVDAWFGDDAARSALDTSARQARTLDRALWAWRLAGRACDTAAMTFWERATLIGFSVEPAVPAILGLAPDFQADGLPPGYPGGVWRLGHPKLPYVSGTWTYSTGRPVCDAPGA
jgi:hypothetical protein